MNNNIEEILKNININLNEINQKINNIESRISNIESRYNRMDNHLDHVENVYSKLRIPLNFLSSQIYYIMGSKPEQLPNSKNTNLLLEVD